MTRRSHIGRTACYTVIGAACAIMQNVVMIAGAALGAHYMPLAVLAFAIVTPLGYLLHARYTFVAPLSWRDFMRFASGIAAGFPLYFIVMATLCSGVGLPVVVAAPVATIVLYVWNYLSAHWAIYR
ncbi:GtrA family protein [Sandarakinorhabdus sp. DWP1-3-1]|uniref:GtrA family protein n=1 Tax=Sandarakinorhabdus sp. DWP1-3-1 TaxID=2804627 RepID=UPI003CE69D1B